MGRKLTLRDKVEIVGRAAEAGFFGQHWWIPYGSAPSFSANEAEVLRRWVYLARSLVEADLWEAATICWHLLSPEPAKDHGEPVESFVRKVEIALRVPEDPTAGYPKSVRP